MIDRYFDAGRDEVEKIFWQLRELKNRIPPSRTLIRLMESSCTIEICCIGVKPKKPPSYSLYSMLFWPGKVAREILPVVYFFEHALAIAIYLNNREKLGRLLATSRQSEPNEFHRQDFSGFYKKAIELYPALSS